MKKRLTLCFILSMVLFIFAGCVAANRNASTGVGENEENQSGENQNDATENEGADIGEEENQDETDEIVQDYTRPSLDISMDDIIVAEACAEVSEEEMELVKKFILHLVWSLEGVNLEDEIKALNDEIFWTESPNREDYIKRIQRFEESDMYYYNVRVELNVLECSETETERVYEISFMNYADYGYPQLSDKPTDYCSFEAAYYITVIEEDGLLLVKSYESKYDLDTFGFID